MAPIGNRRVSSPPVNSSAWTLAHPCCTVRDVISVLTVITTADTIIVIIIGADTCFFLKIGIMLSNHEVGQTVLPDTLPDNLPGARTALLFHPTIYQAAGMRDTRANRQSKYRHEKWMTGTEGDRKTV